MSEKLSKMKKCGIQSFINRVSERCLKTCSRVELVEFNAPLDTILVISEADYTTNNASKILEVVYRAPAVTMIGWHGPGTGFQATRAFRLQAPRHQLSGDSKWRRRLSD